MRELTDDARAVAMGRIAMGLVYVGGREHEREEQQPRRQHSEIFTNYRRHAELYVATWSQQ